MIYTDISHVKTNKKKSKPNRNNCMLCCKNFVFVCEFCDYKENGAISSKCYNVLSLLVDGVVFSSNTLSNQLK